MSETYATVNITWFKRLMEISERVKINPNDLPILEGYIKSAEHIIESASPSRKQHESSLPISATKEDINKRRASGGK